MAQQDLLIKNALLYDGTGAAPFYGAVSVKDGQITGIYSKEKTDIHGGSLWENDPDRIPVHFSELDAIASSSQEVVDADGLSLSPGFIDSHTHADQAIFTNPDRTHVLRMGVTTEIGGNCGHSSSPFPRPVSDAEKAGLARASGQAEMFSSFREEKEAVARLPLGTHQKYFTGHNTLRTFAMGLAGRAPTPAELEVMQSLLQGAMEEGSLGLTTGLSYEPGIFSDTEELAALAKVIKPFGGIYASHSRSESAGLFHAVQECIDIARIAGISVIVSHFKVVGKKFWPRCARALAMFDKASADGLDVTMDCYPYCAVSTTTTSAIPPQFLTEGKEALAAKMYDPDIVQAIYREIYKVDDPSWDNSMLHVGLENFLIVGADRTPEYVGMTYAEAGKKLGISPFEAMIRIMRENGAAVRDVRYAMCEENVEMILSHPLCAVGSDGIYVPGRDSLCHPRALGSFPRYLGRYIRERGILTREEGVRRITGMPADRFGLEKKGYLRTGNDADLVLFDYDSIRDGGDFLHPFVPNTGIYKVYVMGEKVLEENEPTGVFRGRYLDFHRIS